MLGQVNMLERVPSVKTSWILPMEGHDHGHSLSGKLLCLFPLGPIGTQAESMWKSCIVFNDDDDDENARLWSLQYISDDPSFDNEAEINEMIPGQRGGWGVFMFRT